MSRGTVERWLEGGGTVHKRRRIQDVLSETWPANMEHDKTKAKSKCMEFATYYAERAAIETIERAISGFLELSSSVILLGSNTEDAGIYNVLTATGRSKSSNLLQTLFRRRSTE